MKSIITILLVFLVSVVFAGPTDRYVAGNAAFRDGDFSAAIRAYEEALESGAADARVYYNLGNAYYRTGNIGKAVLSYERARFISPRDKDIFNNLDFVRKTGVDIVEKSDAKDGVVGDVYRNTPLGLFFGVLEKISFREFAWAAAIFTILGALFLFIALIVKRRIQKTLKILAVIAWSIALLILVPYTFKRTHIWETDRAIVIAPKVEIRSAPSESSQLKYTFHEGMEVAVKEVRGEFARVILRNGEDGWLMLDRIERVIPD